MEIRKSYFKTDFKTRDDEGNKRFIEGYFAVFNQETELWENCFEKIGTGAFDTSLENNDIRCLFNHASGFVLGRTLSGTLTLRVDEYGLYGSVEINADDRQAMDIYSRVKRGDISGCSFGFVPISENSTSLEEKTLWTVNDVDLQEVSICTFPAYPQTEVQARKKDFEKLKHKSIKQQKINLLKKLEEIKC